MLVSKEELMSKWRIGPKSVEQTMLHTSQQGTRHATFPLSWQYPMDHDHNRLSKLRGYWYADVFSCHQEEDCLLVYNTVFVFDADSQSHLIL